MPTRDWGAPACWEPLGSRASQASRWEPLLSRNMRILRDEYGFDTVAMHRRLRDLADVPAGRRVLDVGTGRGWMAVVLAEGGYDVVAVDVDLGMLMRAAEGWGQASQGVSGRLRLVQADALRLPFGTAAFDAVLSFDMLHHMPDCPRAVSEMLRVRRPTGVFAVADLSPRGLRAVEEVMARGGESHFDNGCRVETVADVLTQRRLRFERHDLDFVTAYILRPDPAVRDREDPCRITGVNNSLNVHDIIE